MAIFSGVTNLKGMIENGLGKISGWLQTHEDTEAGRIEFLQDRYPDAGLRSIQAALRWTENAYQAGQQLELTGETPALGDIPLDSDIPAKGMFRYDVDVGWEGFYLDPAGRKLAYESYRHYTITVDSDTPLDEVQRIAFEQLEERLNDPLNPSPTPSGLTVTAQVFSISGLTRR